MCAIFGCLRFQGFGKISLRTLLWRTTFWRNVFLTLMLRMWFLEMIWNLFCLVWCLCSTTTTTSKLQIIFQTVFACQRLRWFWWRTFMWKTGCCTCNICKCNLGMDDFILVLLQLEFGIRNSGEKCMRACITGSSMLHDRIKDRRNSNDTEASSLDIWPLSFSCCVCEKEWELSWTLGKFEALGLRVLQAIYRHRRYCSDRKRRNDAHAASGCNPEFSHKRAVSADSKRIVQMYQDWLRFPSPLVSMNPKLPWSGEAAADACADHDRCQIGGYLRFSNGDIRWFSERLTYQDFHQLDIPVSSDMRKDISMAQMGLLYSLCHLMPVQRFALTLRSQSDNTAAESTSNSMFTTKSPSCYFVEIHVSFQQQYMPTWMFPIFQDTPMNCR